VVLGGGPGRRCCRVGGLGVKHGSCEEEQKRNDRRSASHDRLEVRDVQCVLE
jgi:hypothetical protein